MRLSAAPALLAAIVLTLTGTAQRSELPQRAAGKIATASWPYLPGSVIPIRVEGFSVPYHVALVGAGRLMPDGAYAVPRTARPAAATVIAANTHGLAVANVRIALPPNANRDMLIVASYDDGIVFHDSRNFSVIGVLGTAGAPSDAVVDASGRIAATDTDGTALTIATLAPWGVSRVEGVPFGDEVASDEKTRALYVTNRDMDGAGALTRVAADGELTHVATGRTPEGLTIDERRQIVYVANVNDDTVAEVDAGSMHVRRRFHAIERVFSLALSSDGKLLYAISNQSAGSPFAAPGAAIAMTLDGARPREVARSAKLTFPIGAVLDPATKTLFVTDEQLNIVYVLDARTLRSKRAPLATCETPWKPALDARTHRLFIPCARAGRIDAFDARTLRRLPGAPFATGGYPLAVTVWHPKAAANR